MAFNGAGFIKNLGADTAKNPFALEIKDPDTVTLALELAEIMPLLELVAVMSPVMTMVPVELLNNPEAVFAEILPTTLIVPAELFPIPLPDADVLAVTFPVALITPVELLCAPYGFTVPVPPVIFPTMFIVPTFVLFAP